MATGKYEPLADQYLNTKVRGSDEFMAECPFCSGTSSLHFNINSGLWLCFKCDEKGNAKRLVQRMGGVYSDPVVSVEHVREHMDRIRTRMKKRYKGPVYQEESSLARYDFPDDYWSITRGFSDETIEKFQLGYDPVQDRHTIPYRTEHGALLGVIQRRVGNEFPRYIYPKTFDRKGSLFGSWIIMSENHRKIALVEGSTDTIALRDAGLPSVAQYGSAISRNQVQLLHRLGIREVVLFYDYDEAGRKAEEKSRQMIDGIIMRTVRYDERKYCWHKKLCGCGQHTWRSIGKCEKKKLCRCGRKHEMDPGSLSRKERVRMFNNAELVGSKKWKR